MSIEFEEERKFNQSFDANTRSNTGGISNWLIKQGIVKSEKASKNLMIFVTIICFSVAIYFAIK